MYKFPHAGLSAGRNEARGIPDVQIEESNVLPERAAAWADDSNGPARVGKRARDRRADEAAPSGYEYGSGRTHRYLEGGVFGPVANNQSHSGVIEP